MPSALGLGRGVVALPRALVATLDAAELDRIALHELAHLRRRDDWTRLGQAIVEAVAGVHPAIWWIGRRLHLECEAACDEFVVARTGDAKRYAASLTRVAAFAGRRAQPSLSPGAGRTGRDLRRRIVRIVGGQAGTRWTLGASHAAGLCGLTAAVAVTTALAPAVVFTEPAPALPPAPALAGVPFVGAWPGGSVTPAVVSDRVTRRRPPVAPSPPVSPQAPVFLAGPGLPDALFSGGTGLPRPPARVTPAPLPSTVVPPLAGTPTLVGRSVPSASAGGGIDRGPWVAVADAGVAVGSGFKKAGLATAGFFTRLGRSFAGGS